MTPGRFFVISALVLFGALGAVAVVKKALPKKAADFANKEIAYVTRATPKSFNSGAIEIDITKLQAVGDKKDEKKAAQAPEKVAQGGPVPEANNIELLFQKGSPLPIVETVKYKSHVSWKAGKPAWLIDWASHYNTPVDFVIRSINGRADYTPKTILDGEPFNVLRTDKDFSFHIVVDLSRCKLFLYYLDKEKEEHFLLKTYSVGLGKADNEKASHFLTPLGVFQLGKRGAVFKPRMMGMHKNRRVELITVFGTRWIPFEKEISGCSEPAKGFGLHGTPYVIDDKTGGLVDDGSSIGTYASDGCIRMKTQDIEEVYSIISTRDSVIEIVPDFFAAKVPYKEKIGS
jgi:hypothetical protein